MRTLEAHSGKSRTELSRQVCKEFGFRTARGSLQHIGCLKALKQLESEGSISLPPPLRTISNGKPRLLPEPVEKPKQVPTSLKDISGLSLELMENPDQLVVWNTIIDEHPRGAKIFAGAQIKYLFRSDHGILGAIGFAASALYLGPRDRWMGWSDAQRQQHLMRVVSLNRFLIRDGVQVKNLASHLLQQVFKRLRVDFAARYGYAPWVIETFVGPEHQGTCLRAAGFLPVGQTTGRGRHAKTLARTRTIKTVFVYALDRTWRKQLGVPTVEVFPKLEVGAGLNSDDWAQQEFGSAQLGNKRRTARLVRCATLLSRMHGEPITGTMQTNHADMRGYYYFLEKANVHGITPEDILAPHRSRTIERMRMDKTVLCVLDSTNINYNTRPKSEGLDSIGRNQTTVESKGVHLHATLALNTAGLPLGVLRCSYRAQEKEHAAKMQQWVDDVQDVAAAAEQLPSKTRVLCVTDRETDAYVIFAQAQKLQRVDLLIRVKADRQLSKKGPNLFALMEQGPPMGMMEVPVERLSRREKAARVIHESHSERTTRLEIRYRTVMLPPTRGQEGDPVKVTAIQLTGVNPPEGEKPILWYLLTSAEITDLDEAVRMVLHYTLRWRQEDIFRALKSVCKVEDLRFRKARSLHLAITINMVIAWRVELMKLLVRENPTAPAEILFTKMELNVLEEYAHACDVEGPKNLGAAARLVALMGGYTNRVHDHPPGGKILARGYTRLEICTLFSAMLQKRYKLWAP